MKENFRWLLIFDNVDQYSFSEIVDDEAYDVSQFFPPADHDSIIIITQLFWLVELGKSHPVLKLNSDKTIKLLIQSIECIFQTEERRGLESTGKFTSFIL